MVKAKIKSSLLKFLFAICIAVAVSWNTVKASAINITCSGTQGSPTAVDEASITSTDDVTFGGTGWCALDGIINAQSVILQSTATLTHTAAYANGVKLLATGNINIGGNINVAGAGALGGAGTGAGTNGATGGGGGNGGNGANSSGGVAGGGTYGDFGQPTNLGSGGGDDLDVVGQQGGSGGGLVTIITTGTVSLGGTINANGNNGVANDGGGGSGGSVWVSSGTLLGSGSITVNGGLGSIGGGSGGGGKIVVAWTDNSAASITEQAYGGGGTYKGGAGTIYTRDYAQTYGDMIADNNGQAGAVTTQPGSLNAFLRNFTVTGGAYYVIPSSCNMTLYGSGNMTINSSSTLEIQNTYTLTIGGTLTVGGTVTHKANTTSKLYGIDISAGSINVLSGGSINVDGKGYATGYGLGISASAYSGGGYGGMGGVGYGGAGGSTYGSVTQPSDLGSGTGTGGVSGGGSIKLTASGTLTVNGSVSANGSIGGSGAGQGGGGSGGSVWINTGTLAGAGTILAQGGAGNRGYGGGGGGGRIAVYYTTDSSTLISSGTKIQAYGGVMSGSYQNGGAGTIFLFSGTSIIGDLIVDNNNLASSTASTTQVVGQGFDSITIRNGANYRVPSPYSLDISVNGGVIGGGTVRPSFTIDPGARFNSPSQSLSITNLNVTNGGTISVLTNLTLSGSTFINNGSLSDTVTDLIFNSPASTFVQNGTGLNDQDMVVGNSGTFILQSAAAFNINSLTVQNTGTFEVSRAGQINIGTVTVNSGGTITHTANSSSKTYEININSTNIDLQSGSNVNANYRGYAAGYGLGISASGYDGGGYGGMGGIGYGGSSGPTYGSVTQPSDLGSGTGTGGASGGGSIKLTASGTLTVNGTLSANGSMSGSGAGQGGGGSGGSVWINTGTLAGAGTILAQGGAGNRGYGGGGGGGRIAVYYTTDSSTLISAGNKIQAYGGVMSGSYQNGGAGTVYIKSAAATNGDLIVDNNNLASSTAYTTQVSDSGLASPLSPTYDNIKIINGANYIIPTTFTINLVSGGTITGGGTIKPSLTINTTGTFNIGSPTFTIQNINVTNSGSIGGVQNLTVNNSTFVNSSTANFPSTLSVLTVTGASTYTHAGSGMSITDGANFVLSGSSTFNHNSGTGFGSGLALNIASGTFNDNNTSLNNLASLTVPSGSTFVQGHNSTITVTGDVIAGGTITHTANYDSTKRYVVDISATNINISGSVDASGKGFPTITGTGQGADGFNGGGGGGYGGGGGVGNGGPGGATPYGSVTAPVDLGSGGGRGTYGGPVAGGAGGGAIKLTVSGTLTVGGSILTTGGTGTGGEGGGGSGGSVYINAGTITGGGSITATGGLGGGGTTNGGGGGGGRIAIYYTTDSSSGPKTAFGGSGDGSYGGAGTVYKKSSAATNGDLIVDGNNQTTTAYTAQVTGTSQTYDNVTIKNGANYRILGSSTILNLVTSGIFTTGGTVRPSLTIDSGGTFNPNITPFTFQNINVTNNGNINTVQNITVTGSTFTHGSTGTFPATLSILTVTGASTYTHAGSGMSITDGANFVLSGSSTFNHNSGTGFGSGLALNIASGTFNDNNTSLNNLASLTVPSGSTFVQGHNSTITVTGDVIAGGTITHTANYDSTKRYVVDISATNINISGSVDASGKGFPTITGTGQGADGFNGGGGGGYGGGGGVGNGGPGGATPYGSVTAPVDLGSGGGRGTYGGPVAGGAGGGAIKLTVSGTLTVGGSILTTGGTGTGGEGGGGSGGSVYINAGTITGGGSITATGGLGGGGTTNGGGGGGGRIAIYYTTDSSSGPKTAFGGSGDGSYGGAGTVYKKSSAATNGDLIVDGNNQTTTAYTAQVTGTSQTYDNVTIKNGANYVIPNTSTLAVASGGTLTGGGTVKPSLTINTTGAFNTPSTFTVPNINVTNSGSIGGVQNLTVNNCTFVNSSTANFPATLSALTVTGASTYTHAGSGMNITNGANFVLSGNSTFNHNSATGFGSGLAFNIASGTFNDNNISLNSLASLTVPSGSTFVQGHTSTIIVTGAVTIGGTLTHLANTTSPKTADLDISAGSIDLQSTGSINANAKGFTALNGFGAGGSGGSSTYDGGGGGGHGGNGGTAGRDNASANTAASGGITNDSVTDPVLPGSGGGNGGSSGTCGGTGGGAIKLSVSGTMNINGNITANGGNATYCSNSGGGGGAGGSVYIYDSSGSLAISGTTGTITANGGIGGNGGAGAGWGGGGGGAGGRISIRANTSTYAGTKQAYGSAGGIGDNPPKETGYIGGAGTIFTKYGSATNGDILVDGNDVASVNSYTPTTQITGNETYNNITIRRGADYLIPNSSSLNIASGGTLTSFVTGDSLRPSLTINSSGTFTPPPALNTIFNIDVTNNGTIATAVSGLTVSSSTFVNNGAINSVQNLTVNSSSNFTNASLGTFPSTLSILTVTGASTYTNAGPGMNITNGSNFTLSGNSTFNHNSGTGFGPNLDLNIASGTFNDNNSSLGQAPSNKLASLTIPSGSTFSQGHTSTITVTGAVTIGGTLTHLANTTSPKTAVVDISAGSIDVQSGGNINVNSKGFTGTNGSGAGGSSTYTYDGGAGGGHGGNGGTAGRDNASANTAASGGITNDSVTDPVLPGSGGGSNPSGGSCAASGGGAVKLSVSGTLSVNGNITANGGNGTYCTNAGGGGGAGGSIYIYDSSGAMAMTGTTGTITANGGTGGNGGPGAGWGGGGGGAGGRVSIRANTSTYLGTQQAYGSAGGIGDNPPKETGYTGGAGTIFSKYGSATNGDLLVDGNNPAFTNSNTTQLTGNETYNNVNILRGAKYILPGASNLSATGYMTIGTGSSSVEIQNANTLTVGNLIIQSTGSLTHSANTSSKASYLNISATNVDVQSGGTINVDGKGYSSGNGTGKGGNVSSGGSGGAGYGGGGGNGSGAGGAGGAAYGSNSSPDDMGSGGGLLSATAGGSGGGEIKITTTGNINVSGTLSANGATATNTNTGGGSGGAIWITTSTMSGIGSLTAIGGNGNALGGGGGGGRISIGGSLGSTATKTVMKGTGNVNGADGTIYIGYSSVCGNGVVESGEQCDDNNGLGGDGCSALCTIETGWSCDSGNPSYCYKCGNGIVESLHENCDDGNSSAGDGCDSTCHINTAGYANSQAITIYSGKVSEALTNFPVLLKDSVFGSSVYNNTKSDGSDLLFTSDVGGTNALPFEVVGWNTVAKTGEVWVKVPSVAFGSDTVIYVWYKNSSALMPALVSTNSKRNVWDSNYKAVWHMGDAGPTTAADSTVNGNTGTQTNGVTFGASGQIGKATSYNGNNTYITAPSISIPTSITASAWVYSSNFNQQGFVVEKGPVNTQWEIYFDTVPSLRWRGADINHDLSCTTPANNQWHYVVGKQTGTTATMYIDGTQCVTGTATAIANGAGTIDIGRHSSGYYYNGTIDELRLSNTARSAGWISTEYNDQKFPFSFAGYCGNGVIAGTSEQCDDGNNVDGDGCSSTCQISKTGYGYKQNIAIDHTKVGENLTDFPVLFKDNNFSSDVYSRAQSNGRDLVFSSDEAGTTLLPSEVVSWNSGAQTSEVWVKVPSISATTDTTIWVWYGNPSATLNSSAGNVWSNNYRGVWHLNETVTDETTGGTHYDSTVNANNGTQYNNATTAGKIGNGQSFDGNADYITIPSSSSISLTGPHTLSVWAYRTAISAAYTRYIVREAPGNVDPWVYYGLMQNNNTNDLLLQHATGGAGTAESLSTNADPPFNQWYKIDAVYTGTQEQIYINGALNNSRNMVVPNQLSTTTTPLVIGGDTEINAEWYTGLFDEVRVASAARSAGWITTEYNNQNSPSTFAGFCGNGAISGTEQCDDGNLNSGDGCSATCTLETGYKCSGSPSSCHIACGDGTLDAGETCDDGNTVSGDGCSSTCQISNAGWSTYQAITIDHTKVGANLTNFPVLLSNSTFLSNVYTNTKSDGSDLFFTSDSAGTNPIPFEVVSWNTVAKTSEVWVNVPSISTSADTTIYAWYNNPSALIPSLVSNNSRQKVWDSNYKGVWHLNETVTDESSGAIHYDSTSNAMNGSQFQNTNMAGKIGNGQSFDGSNDYINLGTSTALAPSNFTIEFWMNGRAVRGDYDDPLSRWGNSTNTPCSWLFDYRPGLTMSDTVYTSTAYGTGSTATLPLNSWNYVAATYDGSYLKDYVNNNAPTQTSVTGTVQANAGTTAIGCKYADGTCYYPFNGIVDEVRISSVARSAGWLSTEYNNQNSQDTFFLPICGNGVKTGTEQCDDGNTNNGDGCSSTCQISTTGYASSQAITIYNNKVNADLTNFPVLLKDNNFGNWVYNNTKSDGSDLLFTSDAGGTTPIPFEVVNWNTSAKTGEVWVKAPNVADLTDTTIYLWYNNPSAIAPNSSASNYKNNVWDSNYNGVWHLGDAGPTNVTDSTSNMNTGTQSGGVTFGTTGKIGNATSFDGNNDYIDVSGSTSFSGDRTITAWVKPATSSGNGRPITTGGASGAGDIFGIAGTSGNCAIGQYELYVDHWGSGCYDSNLALTPNAWNFVGFSYAGSNSRVTFFANGNSNYVTGLLYNYLMNTYDMGGDNIGGSTTLQSLAGSIDEFHISSVARSSGWISTEYNNQSSPSTFSGYCGNGVVTGTEACDDGNNNNGDGCSSSCTVESGWGCTGSSPSVCTPLCGNGVLNPGETCDDGNTAYGDGCSSSCTTEIGWTCSGTPSYCHLACGNGIIDPGEECDDGNLTNWDGCSSVCSYEEGWTCSGQPSVCGAVCGDGLLRGTEACDDGNLTAGDGCSAICSVENGWECSGEPSACNTLCGNGILNSGEACDDHNKTAGDGCSSSCTVEGGWKCSGTPSVCHSACGDGTLDAGEQCDDGNTNNNDGCNSTCHIEYCGDGIKQTNEQCDDGNNTNGDGCDFSCHTEVCGNGIVQAGEQCDDGNLTTGDGCDSSCTLSKNGYNFKQSITIDHTKVAANLTNFPVLLKNGNFSSDVYSKTQSNGADLLFSTDINGTNLIPSEVVNWNSGAQTSEVWVKVPNLSSSTDTTIWVWYNNPSATTLNASARNVWDSNYKGVWHMNDNTASVNVADSTGVNNGTAAANTSTKTVAGQIGGALNFGGSSDYVKSGPNKTVMGNLPTISFWVKPAGAQSTKGIFQIADALTSSTPWIGLQRTSSTSVKWNVNGGYNLTETVNDNTAYYLTLTYDGAVWRAYKNGAPDGAYTGAIGSNTGGYTWLGNGFNGYYSGTIDEVHVSNINRFAGWIMTEYTNQNSPSAFAIAGSPRSSLPLPKADNFPVIYGTTDFSSALDLTAVPDLKLSNAYGSAEWQGSSVYTTNEDYDSYVRLGSGFISMDPAHVNSTLANNAGSITGFRTRVELKVAGCDNHTVYYSSGFYNTLADIKAHGQVCNASTVPACTDIRCIDNTLSFYVPHFDSYGGEGTGAGLATTAGVANSSPMFTVTPSDGGSSSGAPTNVGSNVTFTATAKDLNSDQYYLAVCKTNAITAGNGTAPTCDGGAWAISVEANSNVTASVNYTVQNSDATVNNWYAFVCDKVTGGGACYPATGSGDQGFAIGTVTFIGVPADGTTVTADGVTYEFDTAGNGVTGGNTAVNTATADVPLDAANALVTAYTGGTAGSHAVRRANIVYVYANTKGASGNSIGMAKAGDTGSVIAISGANLTGVSDANASPFYVRHVSSFGTVAVTDTSDGTIQPGDILKFKLAQGTIIADSNVNMYICSSSATAFNYSANTCTGGTVVCSATNVDPTSQDAVCIESGNNLVPIPTSHGSKSFKVYVEDISDISINGTNSQTYTVTDVPPVWASYGAPAPGSLTAGGSTNYTFTVSLTDNNGDNDVTGVRGIFFDKGASVTHSCAANDNNCYIQATCTLTGVGGGADNSLGATCTVPVWYNANASGSWDVEAVATDGTGNTSFQDAGSSLTIAPMLGLDVVEGSIAYGSVSIGYASAKATTTIANMGNQSLDIILTGTNMCTDYPTCSGSGGLSPISFAQQKWYHTNTDFNWAATTTAPGPYTLVNTSSGYTDADGCLNRDIAVRGSDHTSTATNESIYWKLKIPNAQPIGIYTGKNTFTATAGSTCTGQLY
jgi:cysteine-rich repeat protein